MLRYLHRLREAAVSVPAMDRSRRLRFPGSLWHYACPADGGYLRVEAVYGETETIASGHDADAERRQRHHLHSMLAMIASLAFWPRQCWPLDRPAHLSASATGA